MSSSASSTPFHSITLCVQNWIEMENNKITLILVLLFLSTISGSNITNISKDGKIIPWKKSQHKYAMFWRCHSLLGLVGTCFNSFILYLFVREALKKINRENNEFDTNSLQAGLTKMGTRLARSRTRLVKARARSLTIASQLPLKSEIELE